MDGYIQKLIEEEKIESSEYKMEKFDKDCSELEEYASTHKNNLKNGKYRALYDGLWNVFVSSKDIVKDSMEKEECELPNGEKVKLEYKDESVKTKILLT